MPHSTFLIRLIACATCAVGAVALAQPPNAARPPNAPAAQAPAQTAPTDSAQSTASPSARATDPANRLDLEAVTARLGRTLNKKFVLDPRVRNTAVSSIPAAEIDYELLKSVLRVNDMSLAESGDVVLIVNDASARNLPTPIIERDDDDIHGATWVTRVITVRNIDPSSLAGILRPLVAQQALLTVHMPDKVIVTDRYDSAKRVADLVRILDAR